MTNLFLIHAIVLSCILIYLYLNDLQSVHVQRAQNSIHLQINLLFLLHSFFSINGTTIKQLKSQNHTRCFFFHLVQTNPGPSPIDSVCSVHLEFISSLLLFSWASFFPLFGQTITFQASDSSAPLARMLILLGFLHFIWCSLASSGVAILQVWGHSLAVLGNYTPRKPSQAVPCLHPRLTLNRFR